MTQPALPASDLNFTVEHVRDLARFAGLPLPSERAAAVASLLNAWVPDANALSEKMSAAAHQALLPATVFTHPGTLESRDE